MNPFLHTQRVDVLHALALVARGREPLSDGLERLADGDPLLGTWARRLAPPLRAGETLPEVLRRARLISRAEGATLAAEADTAAGLASLAESAAAPPRGLALVRWYPTVLMAMAATGYILGLACQALAGDFTRDVGIQAPFLFNEVLGLVLAVLVVSLFQAALSRIRGLRHLQHLWCPEVHRAAAWRDFAEATRYGDDPQMLPRIAQELASTGLTAQLQHVPAWDLPWRTWLMLSRLRIPRALRQELEAEPSGRMRLERLGGADPRAADAELGIAIKAAWPLLSAGLWLVGAFSFVQGLAGPLFRIIEQLNSGG